MNRLATALVIFFTLIILVIGLRYSLFVSFIQLKKADFRQELLIKNVSNLIRIEMDRKQLFKDTKTISWKDENKELVLNGKFHEVVSIKDSCGLAIVTLIEDEQENHLFSHFFSLQNKDPNSFASQFSIFLNFYFLQDKQSTVFFQNIVHTNYVTPLVASVPAVALSPEELPPAKS